MYSAPLLFILVRLLFNCLRSNFQAKSGIGFKEVTDLLLHKVKCEIKDSAHKNKLKKKICIIFHQKHFLVI